MSAAVPLIAGVTLPGPAASHGMRRAALAALEAAGWPNRKREAWRYTDLEPLARATLDLRPSPAPDAAVEEAARTLEGVVGDERDWALVLLDGRRVPGLGAGTLADVAIADPASRSSDATEHPAELAAERFPLAALNTAFTEDGLWLRIPAGSTVAHPIHLVVIASSRTRLAAQPRIVVDVERDARVTLIQHFVDVADGVGGWVNSVVQIRQAPRSSVTLYRFQRHAAARTHTSLLSARLAAEAELNAFYLDLGGGLVRNDVELVLAEPGARAELGGVFLAGAGQHVDNHTVIDHAAGETESAEYFRGIIGERGRGVFNGKAIVRPNAQRIEATQRSDNLLLGEHAEIDAKPELEIYANDVKCSHGCTVGELDADHLFYLRSRGLAEAEARELLTTAFAAAAIERIAVESERARAQALVAERLRGLERS